MQSRARRRMQRDRCQTVPLQTTRRARRQRRSADRDRRRLHRRAEPGHARRPAAACRARASTSDRCRADTRCVHGDRRARPSQRPTPDAPSQMAGFPVERSQRARKKRAGTRLPIPMPTALCASREALPGRGPSYESGVTPPLIRSARNPLECVWPAHLAQLARRELEHELLGPDHPELVSGDALDIPRIGPESVDLALERGDLLDQLLIGLA